MQLEPAAWMIVNEDGIDVFITTDPAAAATGQKALPLYVLDRKDVLIISLYREQHADALSSIALLQN